MTWTYFTALLDGTRFITKDERDELYTNLDSLLTGACNGAGYSLNSDDMDALKDSRLITDRASLDGPSASNTKDRLHAVLEEVAGVFVNYASAVTAALAAESMTSGDRDDILDAGVDSWKLWNYYRRVIDALGCCSFNESESEETSDSFEYAVSFGADTELELHFGGFSEDAWCIIRVLANGVEIYDSDCIQGSNSELWVIDGATVTVPAGTTSLEVEVTVECDGFWAEETWQYSLHCP